MRLEIGGFLTVIQHTCSERSTGMFLCHATIPVPSFSLEALLLFRFLSIQHLDNHGSISEVHAATALLLPHFLSCIFIQFLPLALICVKKKEGALGL